MNNKNYHICIVCSRLDLPGGIERTIVNTANLLQSKRHKITIVVADIIHTTFYPLHESIELIWADVNFGITNHGNVLTRKINLFKHIKKLEQIFQSLQPDIIIGTEYQLSVTSYLAGRKLGAKIFAWEHHHFYWLKKSRFWNYLCNKIYRKVTAVVCLNEVEKNLFLQAGCKAGVIPNFTRQQAKASLNSKTILSIGWLIKRKGFERIPEMAQLIFQKHPDWHWKIIGSGDEEVALKDEIRKRNLANYVFILPPVSSDLEEVYATASLFVQTSQFECFPMVLLEAMSHGVPTIAFDCPTGPAFIINDTIDGLLIKQNDTDAMAGAIKELICNEEKRQTYGDAAYQNITRFSPDKVYELWLNLFVESCSERTRE